MRAGYQFDEAVVLDRLGKLAVQMAEHIDQVVGLEIPKVQLVKEDQNRHDLTQG